MIWSFLKGAADTVLKDLEAQGAREDEMADWQKRFEFQQKMQEKAEAAKRRNEEIARGIDPNTGKAYSTTRGGETTYTDLPPEAIEQAKAEQAATLAKAARDQAKADADLAAKEAAARASGASADASLASIARLGGRAAAQNAKDAAYAEAALARAKNGDSPKKTEEEKDAQREVDAAYRTVTTKQENPEIKTAAQRIRFSNLTPAEKIEALKELMEATE